MLGAIFSVLLLGFGFYWYVLSLRGRSLTAKLTPQATRYAALTAIFVGTILLVSRSFVIVDADEAGHLKRIYFAADLPPGRIIAVEGQKGPQAEILPPGFHFIPFVRDLYELEFYPVVEVPEGQYGLLLARDGRPLREVQFIADPWPEADFEKMLDARHFLAAGGGQKGPQLTVLRPGKYRLNRYLFDIKNLPAVDVPTGHVAVVRSNVQTAEDCPDPVKVARGAADDTVAMPIVPKGCIGVWNEPVPPGRYYLNQRAYVPTIIPTRVQTWTYRGGYKARKINLRVNDDGTLVQQEEAFDVPMPEGAADQSIVVRVEGWTVPVDMRVVVQVHPKDAPKVVASVGDLGKVEDNIITPAIRDVLRTIGGHPERRVLDFVEKRDEITALVEQSIVTEGHKAGVTIQEVRMGEPALPPELLVARLRRQLATQLRKTYEEEKKAQEERIKVERERSTANQQETLVKAEIAKEAAKHRKEQLRLEGEGEKLRQIEIAKGQEAQAAVLGKERTLQLQVLKSVLEVAAENPEIIKVPMVQVLGEQTGLEGAAAVLGSSNFVQMMRGIRQGESAEGTAGRQ
jgi:hypothetical protein